jgi:hypothetical protein
VVRRDPSGRRKPSRLARPGIQTLARDWVWSTLRPPPPAPWPSSGHSASTTATVSRSGADAEFEAWRSGADHAAQPRATSPTLAEWVIAHAADRWTGSRIRVSFPAAGTSATDLRTTACANRACRASRPRLAMLHHRDPRTPAVSCCSPRPKPRHAHGENVAARATRYGWCCLAGNIFAQSGNKRTRGWGSRGPERESGIAASASGSLRLPPASLARDRVGAGSPLPLACGSRSGQVLCVGVSRRSSYRLRGRRG